MTDTGQSASQASRAAQPPGVSRTTRARSRPLERALPRRDRILGVGLDSTEVGNPPEKFAEVFRRAAAEGFRRVAHAGEEGPPEYIRQALDVLGAGYVTANFIALERELGMTREQAVRLAHNGFAASFVDEESKGRLLMELEGFVG